MNIVRRDQYDCLYLTCPEDTALKSTLPPVRWLMDDVMDRPDNKSQNNDKKSSHRAEESPGTIEQGYRAMGVPADGIPVSLTSSKCVCLHGHHIFQSSGA